jgi:serine/threonine protein kinase
LSDNFVPYLAGFQPGRVLAGYRLEALVGAGGMAVVFRARDERLDRPVALKILDPSRAEDPEFRQRFIAESWAAAKVDDPHIIPVYDAGEADGVLFIAMRFVHGGDLRNVLEREGALSAERATAFISPVASALDAAHAAGLVHRDVKPANILVDTRPGRPDEVYLSDFGIAKSATSAVPLTAPGIMMGTPDYSPPEQIDGLDLDGRADQYALACVAYQLLTGVAPFKRDDLISVIAAHLYSQPPSLRQRRRDLPGATDKVLAKAMAKAPDQRYESCGDFAEELRGALGVAPYRPRSVFPLPTPLGDPVTPRPVTLPGSASVPATPGDDTAPFSMPTVTDVRAAMPVAATPEARQEPELLEPAEPREPGRSQARPSLPGLRGRPRMSPRRRRRARTAVKVGVPFAVLAAGVALILVAVTMHRGTPGTAASAAGVTSAGCGSVFSGYPGQQGSVAVSSIASAGGTRLAVGSADDRPAIWRCAGGTWTLVSAAAVDTLKGATMSSVAHGPGGWIAVGEAGSGMSEQPVAVTSANGRSWQPVNGSTAFMGAGACVTAVAADGNGYAVVGNHMSPGRISAAMWSSADARLWAEDNNDRGGTLDGRQAKSRVDAVAAIPAGFVAVGTHGTSGMIWTLADGGQQWTLLTGIRTGALDIVAAGGTRVVAAGYAATAGGGDVPVVVVSTDGGVHWKPAISLPASGSDGQVTALAATGSGFIAEGQLGPAGAQRTVTWSSPNGLTWSAATPVANGSSGIAGMSATGDMATDVAQQCVFM